MPTLSVWFIRTALIYFAVGITLGALLLIHKGIQLDPYLWRFLPAHIEWLLVGWVQQLIMGVAFWMFPRLANKPKRGNEMLIWLSYLFLNAGIGAVVLAETVLANNWLSLSGRLAEGISVALFATHLFQRAKPFGK